MELVVPPREALLAILSKPPDARWIRGNIERWAAISPPHFNFTQGGVAARRRMLDTETLPQFTNRT